MFDKLNRSKKGYQVSDLLPLGIAFVVVTIALSMGAQVLNNINTDQTANSYEKNASTNGLKAVDELGSWLPTIALIVACAVIIGIVVVYLAGRFR